MTTPEATLDLLSPWALAAGMPLPEHCQPAARQVLSSVLQALDMPTAEARAQLAIASASLPETPTGAVHMSNSGTSLSSKEIRVYDDYFGLNHVNSEIPGITLMRSLITMLGRFLDLCEQLENLDQASISTQKQGLRSYAHLLLRVFALEPLSDSPIKPHPEVLP